MAKKYDLYIFDLDGTLVDSSKGIIQSVRASLEKHTDIKLSDEEIKKIFIGPPLYPSFRKAGVKEEILEEVVDTMREFYNSENYKNADIYPDVIKSLEFLKEKNIKLGVATLKPKKMAHKVLDHLNLSKYFDSIQGPTEEDMDGNKALYIEKVLEDTKENSQKTLMIGDYESDGWGAKKMKVDFAAYTGGFGFLNKDVDKSLNSKYILNNYKEFLLLIEKLVV